MDKINIMYVIATLDIGGAEKQLVELVKRLDKRKFNPIVCCLTRGGSWERELKNAGIEYFILGKKFKLDFSVIFKLVRILKDRKIQIMHTWMFTSNFFGRIAGLISRVPILIASERCIDIWKNKLYLFVDKILSCFTDKIICVSKGVQNFYHECAYIPLNKMTVVHNGVEITDILKVDFKKITMELGVKESENIVTTIGRLAPQKGIEYLLYAVPEILKSRPKTKFLIIGEGVEENKLRKLSKRLNISKNIIFTGVRTDVKKLVSITDVFVLASLFEGLPNVVMEVMLAEKPVVATRIPGNDELVIDGETGILIPPKDSSSLASAIITLLKNPQKAKDMGLKGRERIKKHFSIDKTLKKTEELYRRLVKSKIYGSKNVQC